MTAMSEAFNSLLATLGAEDEGSIFAEPVPVAAIPGYAEVIEEPIDLSTIKSRVDCHRYTFFTLLSPSPLALESAVELGESMGCHWPL